MEVGEDSQRTIDVKAEYDGLDKSVRNLTDKDKTFEDTTQADAGDILEYEVNFKIQPLNEYQSNNNTTITDLKYIINDTLKNQKLVKYLDTKTYVSGEDPYMGAFLLEFNINGTIIYYADVENNDINNALKRDLGLPSTDDDLRALVGIRKEKGGINYGEYNDGQQQFSITFEWNTLKSLVGRNGATVTLKYKAELTSDAILKNTNKVELNYSNDPSDHTKSTHSEDTTTVFSYGLDITKTFAGDAGTDTLWKDVTFNLFEASLPSGTAPGALIEGEKIAFIERVAGTAGDYQRANLDDSSSKSFDLKLKQNENTLNVYGLDPGYYILEETSSPNGYLLGGKVYIYIDEYGNVLRANGSALWLGDKNISEGGITGTVETDTKNALQIKIDNQKRDFELPETGAMGVWLFGIGGVLVLAGAAFAYSQAKKKRASN